MGHCLAEKPKTHFPRCESSFDSTSCDHGRNLTMPVSSRAHLLARTIPTHSAVFLSFSFVVNIVLQIFEVDD